MKKTIRKIFGLRILMMAVLSAICGTSWATTYIPGEEGDPLKAWYYSKNTYVLRTLSAGNTVIDAMKALQTINTDGAWSDYSGCTFYLAEDVDFSQYKDASNNVLNWVPLGNATHPFSSNFYAYHPTYQAYNGETALGKYPQYSSSTTEYSYQVAGTFIYKMTKAQMVKVLTRQDWCDDIVTIDDEGTLIFKETENTKYDDVSYYFYDSEGNSLPSADDIVTEGDDKNCTSKELISGSEDDGDALYKYTFSKDKWSIDETINSNNPPQLEYDGYTITEPTEEAPYYTYTPKESTATIYDIFNSFGYTIQEGDFTAEALSTYDLKLVELGSPGYYTDDSDKKNYYTTDAHLGTCKISNLKVEGEYAAAGFFGVVAGGKTLGGFTFDHTCSINSTGNNNYTGMLFGTTSSSTVNVRDIFIGDLVLGTPTNASIKGYYAGGVCGQGGCVTSSELSTEYSNYDAPDYVYDESYKVKNILYVSVTGGNYAGGVYACSSSSIKTEYVDVYANVLGSNSAGGIAGNNSNFTIQYCNVYGTVGATGETYGWAGGLIGYVDNTSTQGSFTNCSVDAEIGSKASDGYAGGVFGYLKGLVSTTDDDNTTYTYKAMYKASNNNKVSASGASGSISDTPINISVTLSDGDKSITAKNWSYYFCCDIQDYLSHIGSGDTNYNTYSNLLASLSIKTDGSAWTGGGTQIYYAFGKNTSGKYGTGTEADPYIIANLSHLTNMMLLVNGMATISNYSDLSGVESLDGKYFKQTSSIAFGDGASSIGVSIGYTDEHPFKGNYDGGGYTISGAYLNGTVAAPVQYASGATIKNLKVTGRCEAQGTSTTAGGLVGIDLGGSTIENCLLSVTTYGTTKGAIVGNCQGGDSHPTKIYNSYNSLGDNSSNPTFSSTQLANGSYIGDETNGTFYPNVTVAGEGMSGKPFLPQTLVDLEQKDKLPSYLTNPVYQLNTDLIDIDQQLVDDDCKPVLDAQDNLLASNYTNTDHAYVQEFRGTINGKGHIIAGLVDNYLFGKFTGTVTINNIGFVNCLLKDEANKTNAVNIYSDVYDSRSMVKLVNNSNDQSVNINYCYSDGNFYIPYTTGATSSAKIKTDFSYVYARTTEDGSNVDGCKYFYKYSNTCYFTSEDKIPTAYLKNVRSLLIRDTFHGNSKTGHAMYRGDNIITITYGKNIYKTDAILLPFLPITTEQTTNTISKADKTAARYFANVCPVNSSTIYNLKVMDFMDYVNQSHYQDEYIDSTSFVLPTGVTSGNIKKGYYKRLHHNDWEAVCLPFSYKLSDVDGYGTDFTAFNYTSNSSSASASTVTFTSMNANATVAAGQPVLFLNESTSKDLVIKTTDEQEFVTEQTGTGYFKGALQTNKSCSGMYKIDGTKTGSGDKIGGNLLKCNSNSWIYPFRAYLDLSSSTARSITFTVTNGDEDNPTELSVVNGEITALPTGAVYSVDGQKVSDKGIKGLKSGLYISGGRKFLVK